MLSIANSGKDNRYDWVVQVLFGRWLLPFVLLFYVLKQYIHDMSGKASDVAFRAHSGPLTFSYPALHRSQIPSFSGFQFPAWYVRCHHRPVAGAVRDGTCMRLSSPEWSALGCVSGVSIPLSSASTPSPARRLWRRLRQGSVTMRRQLVVHLQKRRSNSANSGVD